MVFRTLLSLVLCVLMLILPLRPALAQTVEPDRSFTIWPGSALTYVSDPFATTPRPDNKQQLISVSSTSSSVALSLELYNNFLSADPELFRLTEQGIRSLNFWDEVTDEQMDYVREKTLAITVDCSTPAEEIFAVAKYLAQNVCYDYDYADKGWDLVYLSAYEVLRYEATVCSGFAVTFAVMMQLLGYPCVYVGSPSHAWNMVYNGERWMLVDTTWMCHGSQRGGVRIESDDFDLDWFDFSIEQANGNYNHVLTGLPLHISQGQLTDFPKYSALTEVTIPANVTTINTMIRMDADVLYLPQSLETVTDWSFYYSTVDQVYYEGTSSQFKSISIGYGNDALTKASVSYQAYQSAPVITSHPSDQAMDAAGSVTLTVEAEGGPSPLSYQWYVNTVRSRSGGTPIDGATAASYTVSGLAEGDCRYYYAEITGGGSCFTVPAQVSVFSEVPEASGRLGADTFFSWFSEANEIWLTGSGVIEDYIFEDYSAGNSGCTIHIGPDITYIPENIAASELVGYASQYVVDPANPIYAHDEAGALINQAEGVLLHLPSRSSITEYAIPEGIVEVAPKALQASALTTLHIPASLQSLPDLGSSGQITTVTIGEGNTSFYFDGQGALINGKDHRLLRYWGDYTTSSYTVDDSITSIAAYAFYRSRGLKTVTLPEGLVVIGDYAFSNCYSLTGTLELPNSLASIGEYAFMGCSGLSGVLRIPEGVTSIGREAFNSCRGFTELILPGSVTDMDTGTFAFCSGLTRATLGEGLKVLPLNTFYQCTGITELALPDGMLTVSYNNLDYLTNLTTLTIPASVTQIDAYFSSDVSHVTVYGCAGSYAEEFAKRNNMKFVDVSTAPADLSLAEDDPVILPTGTICAPEFLLEPTGAFAAVTLISSDPSTVWVSGGTCLQGVFPGTATITATTANGLSCQFTVEVRDLDSITLRSLPDKLHYSVGERLDLTGLEVEAAYADGTSVLTDDYTVTGFRSDAVGEYTLTVRYGNAETAFQIEVSRPQRGTLGSDLTWTLEHGKLSVDGSIPDGALILVAALDRMGRCLSVEVISSINGFAQPPANAAELRLFLIGENYMPMCKSTTLQLSACV